MGPSPATVCAKMSVNQTQTWDDSYCTRPVLWISGAGEERHPEKLLENVIVPRIYIPDKGTSE